MKVKKKLMIHAGNTRPLRMRSISGPFVITHPIEELLSLLFGMQLLWGISAKDYLQQKIPADQRDVFITELYKAGYISGDLDGWKFSQLLYGNAVKNLPREFLQCLSFAQKPGTTLSEPPVELSSLRRLYSSLLKDVLPEDWPVHGEKVTNHLRLLSRKIDSRMIQQRMQDFFEYQGSTYKDFSIEALEKFLLKPKETLPRMKQK